MAAIIATKPSAIARAETARFPKGAAQHFDAMFTEAQTRIAAYLETTFALDSRPAAEAAERLLGRLIYPSFARALFGMDGLARTPDPDALAPDFDLAPAREAVAEMIAALQ
ncbi:MAG: hypothetical protein ACLPN5_18435, partial [Roseiarcus sp.]